MWSTLTSVFLLAGAVFVVFAGILTLNQSRLLYFPEQTLVATPADIGLSFKPLTIASSDGLKLSGWFIPAAQDRGVILFCHGNAGNISHRLESIALFHRLGYGVLIFDYRGYGRSEGRPDEEGTYLDAAAAWRHLVEEEGVDPSRIVLFGRSLGGAIAARLASQERAGAVILESTFTSVPDLAADLYPFLPVRLLCRFSYPTRRFVTGITSPLLVVHSPEDEIVPFAQGRAVFAAAPEPKHFLEISGSHNTGFLQSGLLYGKGIEDFLLKALGGQDELKTGIR